MYYKQSCRVKNRNMTSQNLAVQNACKKYLESIVDGIAIISRMSIAIKVNRSR
jgi:hypothetical protein